MLNMNAAEDNLKQRLWHNNFMMSSEGNVGIEP